MNRLNKKGSNGSAGGVTIILLVALILEGWVVWKIFEALLVSSGWGAIIGYVLALIVLLFVVIPSTVVVFITFLLAATD